jgi:hypothetical protein
MAFEVALEPGVSPQTALGLYWVGVIALCLALWVVWYRIGAPWV